MEPGNPQPSRRQATGRPPPSPPHSTYGNVRTWFLWLVTEIDADLESSFRIILIQSSSNSLLILGRRRAAIRIL